MAKDDKVKVHKVPGTQKSWIELPKEMKIKDASTGEKCLMVTNFLKGQPQLTTELKELHKDLEMAELWTKEIADVNSMGISFENSSYTEQPEDISMVNHTLAFFSKDENELNFIKYDIEKKLEERKKLEVLEKEFTHKVVKDSIEIPEFMQRAKQPVKKEEYKPLTLAGAILQDIKNIFFK